MRRTLVRLRQVVRPRSRSGSGHELDPVSGFSPRRAAVRESRALTQHETAHEVR